MKVIRKIVPKYTDVEIIGFKNTDDFMDAYLELLKNSIECLWHIIYLKYFDKDEEPLYLERDEAVVAGNLVRLIKLNTSFLQNICELKMEIALILNRCIAETGINLKYLLIQSESNVRRNYIKHSLITEKDLWNTIKENIKHNSEEVLNIEKRMQISIQNSFESSDFELDEVNRSSKWKSIKSRADEVFNEQFYKVFYGMGSHSVHGNWQDVLSYNLNGIDDKFKVKIEWNKPKPQLMDFAIFQNFDILKTFIDYEINDCSEIEILKYNYNILSDCQKLLYNQSECYLSSINNL